MTNYLPSLEERKLKMFEDVCTTCGDAGEGADTGGGTGNDEQSSDDSNTLLKTLSMLRDKKKAKNKKLKAE